MAERRRRRPVWNGERVRALRQHLGLTQAELARELNVRQQTVSEWETGQYRPRGASERLLSWVAERAAFRYGEREEAGRSSLVADPRVRNRRTLEPENQRNHEGEGHS